MIIAKTEDLEMISQVFICHSLTACPLFPHILSGGPAHIDWEILCGPIFLPWTHLGGFPGLPEQLLSSVLSCVLSHVCEKTLREQAVMVERYNDWQNF